MLTTFVVSLIYKTFFLSLSPHLHPSMLGLRERRGWAPMMLKAFKKIRKTRANHKTLRLPRAIRMWTKLSLTLSRLLTTSNEVFWRKVVWGKFCCYRRRQTSFSIGACYFAAKKIFKLPRTEILMKCLAKNKVCRCQHSRRESRMLGFLTLMW